MRSWPAGAAAAICSAAPTPCVGTKPSARAASWSRQPATSTAPSRPSAGAQAPQSANGSSGWCVRPSRYARSPSGPRRPPLGLAHETRAPARCRRVSRERTRGTAAGSDARTAAGTGGPGSRSRRRRRGTRRARAAARARARGTRRATGSAARAAGTASCAAMPRQIASSGSPSVARALLGPAQQRLGVRDRRRPGERRRDPARGGNRPQRRAAARLPGSAPNTCRSGERDEALDATPPRTDSRAASRPAAAA